MTVTPAVRVALPPAFDAVNTYVVLAIGWAATGLVPATTLVTRWFHRRRSLALSISSTGLSVGGLTLTKLAASRIDHHGLADTAPILAVAWVVPCLLIAWFLWPSPASRGTAPDGDAVSQLTIAAAANGATYDEAVHSRFFVAFTVAYVAIMCAQVGGIAQLAKLGQERADKPTGALAVSVLAFSSVCARRGPAARRKGGLLSGAFNDRECSSAGI